MRSSHANAENCTLGDPISGKLITHLTRAEADRMVSAGTAKRCGPHKYCLVAQVMPSNSKKTSPEITLSDLKRLVGLQRVNQVQLERLIGLGLVPEGTPYL